LPSQNKKPTGLSHYNNLGENGMLSIRTCKSTEDRIPSIGGTSEVHTVDVFCPKTPQRLYFTPEPVDNSVVVDSDDSTSASSSSSEGFLPNLTNTSATTVIRSSSRNKPVTVVGVPDPANHDSTDHKGVTVVIIPDLNNQHESIQSIENQTVTPQMDAMLNGSLNANSRSCSPLTIKESNQQKPLKDFSLKVVKLPQSMLGGSYLSTSLQNSPTEAKFVNDEEKKESPVQQIDHTEATSVHHNAKPQQDATTDSTTETDSLQNSNTMFSTEDVETDPVSNKDVQDRVDPLCNEDVQDNSSVTTNDDCNASPYNSDSHVAVSTHFHSTEDQCKPSTNSDKEDPKEPEDSSCSNNCKPTSSSALQSKPNKTKHKTYKSMEFITSSFSEQEDTFTNTETHKDSKQAHPTSVSTKSTDCGEEYNAIGLKQMEFQVQESQTLQLSPSPRSLPVDDDLNHSSPLFKRKLFSSDKENSINQNSHIDKKSSNKPKLRSKGILCVPMQIHCIQCIMSGISTHCSAGDIVCMLYS